MKTLPGRAALTVAAVALSAATLTACGAGEPPTDASVEDFCSGITGLEDALSEFGEAAKPEEAVEALKEEVQKIQDTGTPEDADEDARDGFEVITETILDLNEDTTLEDLGTIEDDLSDEEREQTEKFQTYLSETCSS